MIVEMVQFTLDLQERAISQIKSAVFDLMNRPCSHIARKKGRCCICAFVHIVIDVFEVEFELSLKLTQTSIVHLSTHLLELGHLVDVKEFKN